MWLRWREGGSTVRVQLEVDEPRLRVQSCVPVRTETLWPKKADVGVEGAKPHTLACNHDGRAGSAPE